MTTLRPQQERFCQEYLVDLNATDAYIRAGYKVKSPQVAAVNASRLLTDAKVKTRIQELMEQRSKRVQLRQDDVLRELALIAYSDVRHFQVDDATGALLLCDGAAELEARAVSSVKRRVTYRTRKDGEESTEIHTELRLWDKPAALRMCAQHLGLLIERHELTGADGGPIQHEDLDGARQRLADRADRIATRLGAAGLVGAIDPNGRRRRAS